MMPQPAGPQGTGTTAKSNLSPTLECTFAVFQEPDMKIGFFPVLAVNKGRQVNIIILCHHLADYCHHHSSKWHLEKRQFRNYLD
tara:strand:- start:333 stop:584 length:252 start_codon:yes stop_codon:yes gene_type:complete